MLNNTNQVTPDGSLTYDTTGSYSWKDPYTGRTYELPTFTATQTLSDNQQAIKDQTDAANLNLATLANDQTGFLNDYMANPFSYNSGQHEQWAGNLYDQLNSQKVADNTEALRTQLANQGIKVGSDAYNKAMSGLQTSQMDSRNKFMLDSQSQGFNQALATRSQPLNEIASLMSGGQVSYPNYVNTPGAQVGATDNASIIANADNAKMSAWQQNQSSMGGLLGGLGGLFSGLGKAGFSFSDERLKEDVRRIGETADGIGLYAYRFRGNEETKIGMLAQEVRQKRPEAVRELPNGILMVDYAEATK